MVRYYCDRCRQEIEHYRTVLVKRDFEPARTLAHHLCERCIAELIEWVRSVESSDHLGDLVNDLLDTMRKRHEEDPTFRDAVNWGNLRCVDVRQFIDGDWYVVIAEADPAAHEVRSWIREGLSELGYRVHVVTEW